MFNNSGERICTTQQAEGFLNQLKIVEEKEVTGFVTEYGNLRKVKNR